MSDARQLSVESTIQATGTVLGLLPQIAGFVVGLSALAYLTGWREATAYYNGLGAPWALSLLSSAQIMQTGIWLVSLIAIFSFLSVLQLTQGAAGQKGLRRWSILFLVLGALALGASLFLHGTSSNVAAGAASFCWAVSAGLTIGELVACLAEDNLRWGEYQVFLLYFIVFYGLLQASSNMGESRAKTAGGADSSLPRVALALGADNGNWRLVAPMAGKMLLILPSEERKDRHFKLVEASAIDEIVSSAK